MRPIHRMSKRSRYRAREPTPPAATALRGRNGPFSCSHLRVIPFGVRHVYLEGRIATTYHHY
jgi:hypothetical protein